ncbi:MAG: aminoacyl-tRNA hydrolase [Azospira oryzae]|uniref:Peptidyl-tRNA hydrolase n=1 Tax=Pelomicrobium methylotrophicum TaxID=2602750 RepID=A0A5C7EHS3_9PROT|nr:aminoacyl-tRNA hydrolase [Pelomicrobium methylotrophicum]PZP64800.1 MAG: aminoacyl-tRNA hydrolase [Azospira oryzae]PZP82774.1 MAG: aminoacyl-tRNA hydrolase [Azospira oryzae]TXF10888.1 aminoacyl-tRNA hydrolase [Pelomicrobium methylotrophicum]
MQLVVGLGNPGAEYARTRHNAGFWWVDRIAERHRAVWREEPKFHGAVARVVDGEADVWLLKPFTYMNLSGRAVGAMARFYKIAPERLLVAHDELDFAPGTVKLKRGGGVAGHNGLKDIAAHLATPNFWRLRIGIGHPGVGSDVAAYVLSPPRSEELGAIEQAIARGLEVWPLLARGQMEAAMQKLHTKR